jgi:tryptophan halogenase
MAAAYLNAALNPGSFRRAEISLVESPDTPRIGVGEATIPSILHLLAVIGVDANEFMKAVDATFKQSIRYVNWLNNTGEFYHHPFTRYSTAHRSLAGELWLGSNRSIPFMETVSPQPIICEMGLSPLSMDPRAPGPRLKYAYHMNALKFADYLTEFSTARGVTHHLDHVTDIEMAENGDIAAVTTKSGQRIEADLFIDCTGFAALLIEKKLGVGWVDCSQWLLCDQAVTMHVPYDHHYQATALSSGWVWDIPLRSTRSLGYVHSSAFQGADEAEQELRAFEGPHAANLSTRLVPFKVGHREQAWSRNCIAIGLAGSFIEPLESTGLYLSDLATVMLAEHFPRDNNYEPLAFRVNRILTNRFYEILDFINMHYCLTRRTDTAFWREIGKPERITERLRAKLDYWRIKPPSPSDFETLRLRGPVFPGHADGVVTGRRKHRGFTRTDRYRWAMGLRQLRSDSLRHGFPGRGMPGMVWRKALPASDRGQGARGTAARAESSAKARGHPESVARDAGLSGQDRLGNDRPCTLDNCRTS